MGQKNTTHTTTFDPQDPTTRIATGQTVTTDTRSLFEAQAEAVLRAAQKFDALIVAGRVIGAKTYQIDDASRAAMLNAWNNNVWPITWIAMDNSTISLTQAQFQAGGQNILQYYNAMVLQRRTHKTNIVALADIPSCDAYDVSTGWPP